MGFYMSSPHHLSPLIVGSVVRAPLRHHAARAAASPHIRLDPRRSKPQSRMLAGAGLGGMGPFWEHGVFQPRFRSVTIHPGSGGSAQGRSADGLHAGR